MTGVIRSKSEREAVEISVGKKIFVKFNDWQSAMAELDKLHKGG